MPSSMTYPLLLDGAMGTFYRSLFEEDSVECENANLQAPENILFIHKEYLAAGAQGIKTNTFLVSHFLEEGRNDFARATLQAAVRIATEAIQDDDALIFGDIGPASLPAAELAEVYIEQLSAFLKLGIHHFIFETLSSDEGLQEALSWLKKQDPDAYVLVCFSSMADGLTQDGLPIRKILERCDQNENIDALGLNCSNGPHHTLQLYKDLKWTGKPFALLPNAGYPRVLGRKLAYTGTPEYFASILSTALDEGVCIAGGCCGTTPKTIAALKQEMETSTCTVLKPVSIKTESVKKEPVSDSVWKKMSRKEKVFAVEVDPPKNDSISSFMEGVGLLSQSGADMITLADCPVGRPRADSSLLACKIKRELGISVLPHMTCRDRNLNAAKALLIGLSIEDVHNVLLITGDPIPSALRDEVKSVFSYNSRKLAGYVSSLAEEGFCQPFRMYGALNINARNFDVQLAIAKEKQAQGMEVFLTQPVHSKRGLENLKRARNELDARILGGLYPIVSYKNGLFLKNEIGGMDIDDELLDLYQGLDRQQAEKEAEKISIQIADEMADFVDGYYIMTPFNRISLVQNILQGIRKRDSFRPADSQKQEYEESSI